MIDIVALTAQLVAYPSYSYHELPLMQHIARLLEQQDVPHILDRYQPGAILHSERLLPETANIYVDIGQGDEALVLYAHTDVVVGHSGQFQPQQQDSWLIGRGAVDMKSSLAALILTSIKHYQAIQRSGKRVIFAYIADEETSGTGARQHIRWLRQQNLKTLWVVLTEPTDDFAIIHTSGKGYVFIDLIGNVRDLTQLLRELHQRRDDLLAAFVAQDDRFGKPYLSLTTCTTHTQLQNKPLYVTQGQSAHASRPEQGHNALEAMLLQLDDRVYAINTGENSPNTIPDHCTATLINNPSIPARATLDIRTTPEADSGDALLDVIDNIIRRYPDCTYQIRDRGRAYTNDDHHVVRLCQSSVSPTPRCDVSEGGSDAGYYAELTPHIVGGFGPGDLRYIHTDDERIKIESLVRAEQVFERLVLGYIQSDGPGSIQA